MNTLSSGYAASANRSVSGTTLTENSSTAGGGSAALECAHMLSVFTRVGEFCRGLGKKVVVKKRRADATGREWRIGERPACAAGRRDCAFHSGADVRDLHVLAERLEEEEEEEEDGDVGEDGLWLCSE